jgi:hypothetical protein
VNAEIDGIERDSRVWDGEILEMYTNTGYKSHHHIYIAHLRNVTDGLCSPWVPS